VIELDDVTKTYDDTTAIDSLDLRVESGMTSVLIGPSGCGKSTTLRSIIGLIEPDSGSIQFDGEKLDPSDRERLLSVRRRMGYVIQGGGLFPHLTARRNALLLADEVGWKEDRKQRRMEDLAEMTRFPLDGLDRYPAQLSGGQKQRVSLMRALMLEPDVLLMDEPLGALDPMIRADLRKELDEIFERLENTVLMVTHNLNEAVHFADEIVLMQDGAIVQTGMIEDFLESPSEPFVEDFVRAQESEW
jgi:osmoprotectant transport system ATP-binding protein